MILDTEFKILFEQSIGKGENQMNGPQKHVVAICEDERVYENPFVVAPGKLVVRLEDEIEFQNLSTVEIKVDFLNGNTPFNEKDFLIAKDNKKAKDVLKCTPGSYPYKILCGEKEKHAQGSLPIIIIIKD